MNTNHLANQAALLDVEISNQKTDETPLPSPQESPGQKARSLLKNLQDTFPVFSDSLPLAIGIDKMLRERVPDIDRKVLRISLGIHTHSLRYLKTLEKATHRVDLDGKVCEEISEEHRQHAKQTIRERSKKQAERKKATRQAEEAEAQEKERREKLTQLVQKFGSAR